MPGAWFVDWFDSPFYHMLYNHRNDEEAADFIGAILNHLNLPKQAELWDIACGKGRHANAMHRLGYRVIGSDLSVNSITAANQSSQTGLSFVVHDMRNSMPGQSFDAAFNLFTSIGYFENINDNARVFKAVADSLKPGGYFVIDFFNPYRVSSCMGDSYIEKRDTIDFNITKQADGKVIRKFIQFETAGRSYTFEEVVTLLTIEDFDGFAHATGFKRIDLFGNYQLTPYQKDRSDRLILCYQKIDE